MLQITLLADEWKYSKGGLSTMNRELAKQLAKHPSVTVTFLVPKCGEADKQAARSHDIRIVEAKERPGYEPLDWLSFPPSDLVIDIIIGHGVKLGKQAQVMRDSHHCTWMQVVHTAPEELAMFKHYSGAISKGDEKQWNEVRLCEMANIVVAVGPKLHEFYSAYLSSCDKKVFNLTPGIFTELSSLKLSTQGVNKFRVLVFGRGDSDDFELKGFDIAAKAVAKLNDRSYHLTFVGAPSGKETQVRDKLLKQGLYRRQLIVKGYLNREYLARLLCASNVAIIPSRTEGFGLTALEALSAGLPFLVSQNSGFGEALQQIPSGSSWIVDSEEPEHWAEAIKRIRVKGRETTLNECQELRARYAEKYSWEKQCNDLVEMMIPLVHASEVEPSVTASLVDGCRVRNENSEEKVKEAKPLATPKERPSQFPDEMSKHLTAFIKEKRELTQPGITSESAGERVDRKSVQPSRLSGTLHDNETMTNQRREPSLFGSSNKGIARANSVPLRRILGATPKEMPPSSLGSTKTKERRKLPQPGMVYQPGRKRVEGDQGQTSTQTSSVKVDQLVAEQRQRTVTGLFRISNSSEERAEGSSYNHSMEAELRTEGPSFSRSNSDEQRTEDGLLRISNNPEEGAGEGSSYIHSNNAEEITGGSSFRQSNSAEQRTEDGLFRTSNNSVEREGGSSFDHSNDVEQRTEGSLFMTSNNSNQRAEENGYKHSNNAEQRRTEGSLFSRSNDAEKRTVSGSFSSFISGTDDSCYTSRDSRDHVMKTSVKANRRRDEQPQRAVAIQPSYPPDVTEERVMLKSRLCNGRVSYQPGDIEILHPGFEVPDLIKDFLLENYGSISEAEVRIVSVNGDENQLRVQCSVDPKSNELPKDEGSQITSNEILKLKTRLRYGKVSFEKEDVEFISPDFEISQYFIECLEREYWSVPNCELCLIIDTKGNLTPRVETELKDRVYGIFNKVNKVWKRVSN